MGQNTRETEIKLRVEGPGDAARMLERAGFRLARPRVFEANTIFDTPSHNMRDSGTLLRVRDVAGSGLLTYKGPASVGRHKSREELEVQFEWPPAMHAILARLGFQPAFRYEKYRTEYSDGSGLATIDETPIGCFMELEGGPEWIDQTAHALGFEAADYITASYAGLYLEHCAARGIAPGDMIFPPEPRGCGI
jgi:adenylate cyclase class 2